MWRVQVLAQQQKGVKRRTEMGHIAVVQDDDEPIGHGARSVRRYMDLLWTLLLACAKAGAKARADAPNDGEPLGSNSTLYVEVPLDVCLRYHRRAQAFALQLPPPRRLLYSRPATKRRGASGSKRSGAQASRSAKSWTASMISARVSGRFRQPRRARSGEPSRGA